MPKIKSERTPWQIEIDELAETITRAMIFGIALVYTMEAWWSGEHVALWKLLVFFAAALLVNLYLLPIATGDADMPFIDVVLKVVRNMGLAILVAFGLLLLLDRISPFEAPYERDLATVLLLSIPISIGGDVARIYNLYTGGGQKQQQKTAGGSDRRPWRFILKDIGSSSGGALFVALPIALTGEIPLLAAELGFWRELAVIAVSLLFAHLIVYGTGVSRTPPSGKGTSGAKVWPYADAMLSYIVALIATLAMLFLFDRIELGVPAPFALSMVIVAGLPAVIGAAAGKLVL